MNAEEQEILEKIGRAKEAQVAYDAFVKAMRVYCDEVGERYTDTCYVRGFETRIKRRLEKLRLRLLEVRGE